MVLESLVQNMRYAVRDLRAAPLFSTVAILTLAVGSRHGDLKGRAT
jgi:hypothetical protein